MATQLDKFQPKSSFIEQAEYDADNRSMTLTFKNGTSYRYLFVFPAVWANFKQAVNHSVYYSKMIKGKLLSVPLIKKAIGQRKSTPLHKINRPRSLTNGTRNFPSHGLIPSRLRSISDTDVKRKRPS